jgi:hypothetical protein
LYKSIAFRDSTHPENRRRRLISVILNTSSKLPHNESGSLEGLHAAIKRCSVIEGIYIDKTGLLSGPIHGFRTEPEVGQIDPAEADLLVSTACTECPEEGRESLRAKTDRVFEQLDLSQTWLFDPVELLPPDSQIVPAKGTMYQKNDSSFLQKTLEIDSSFTLVLFFCLGQRQSPGPLAHSH